MAKIVAQPTFTCDVCGVALAPETLLGYKLTCTNPGHGRVGSFDCPDEGHHACSPEHMRQALLKCFDEMEAMRQAKVVEAQA